MTRADAIVLTTLPAGVLFCIIMTGFVWLLPFFAVHYFMFLDMLSWPDRA